MRLTFKVLAILSVMLFMLTLPVLAAPMLNPVPSDLLGTPASLGGQPGSAILPPKTSEGTDAALDVELVPPEPALDSLASELSGEELPTIDQMRRLARDYYANLGYDVGPVVDEAAAPTKYNEFNENSTISFTYPLGDVDGDGYDDLALNVYCVDWFCRYQGGGSLTDIPPSQLNTPRWCGTPHRLFALSGNNGTVLWETELGKENFGLLNVETTVMPYCPVEFVVGTMRDNLTEQNHLLMYRFSFMGVSSEALDRTPWGYLIRHQFYVLNAPSGKVMWQRNFEGSVISECDKPIFFSCTLDNNRHVMASNLLVNPVIMSAPDRDVDLYPGAPEESLFLQGVGFNFTLLRGVTPPGFTQDRALVEQYIPNEWAARLNPITGATMWTTSTFTGLPVNTRSIQPALLQVPSLAPVLSCYSSYRTIDVYSPWGNGGYGRDGCGGYSTFVEEPKYYIRNFGDIGIAMSQYWHIENCCSDVTGDGVPDLVYTTVEWSTLHEDTGVGPKFLDSRLVVFDGATGKQLYEHTLAKDSPRFIDGEYFLWSRHSYAVRLEQVGDATGDGIGDILVHRTFYDNNFTQIVSIHDGKSGDEVWRQTSLQRLSSLVIGDANKDGGNDIVLLRWHSWEFPRITRYDLTNVTATGVEIISGKDGSMLWQTETFNAPIDLYVQADAFRQFGMPDLNGDGVGEVLIDDPAILPDLTVVHHQEFLSGTDGTPIYGFNSVGMFSLVSDLSDTNRDNVTEFVVLSGDVPDLWMTIHNGTDGQGIWSRRLLAPRVADYVLAFPHMSFVPIHTPNGTGTLVNFQLEIQTSLNVGSFFLPITSLYPQTTTLEYDGKIGWSYPKFYDPTVFVLVPGGTPATIAWQKAVEEASKPHGLVTFATEYGAVTAGAVGTAAAGALTGGIVGNWRLRK